VAAGLAGGDGEAEGAIDRQVFQAVHRQIDAPIEQRLFNLFREQPFRADLRQWHVGNLVAGSLDDFNACFMPALGQTCANPLGLPKREL